MSGRWLTMAEAAERLGKSRRTLRAWVHNGDLSPIMGRVRESELLRVDQAKRQRMLAGRAKGADTPP